MNRSERSILAFILMLVSTSCTAYSQPSEARRYFPHAAGNMWRWVSLLNASTYDSEITRDSTDAAGNTFLFYNGATNPRYKIDVSDDVFQFLGPSSVVLWFKLAAQDGDSFYTWNNGYKIKVRVHTETVFGHPTVTKVFTWYLNPPGTYMYARQSLARDFGMIRTYAELGPLDDYVTGCVIDSVRYGSLVPVPEVEGLFPLAFALEQNYPNPFNPITTIKFSLRSTEHVRLSIHDVLGREVAVLVNDMKPAGEHLIPFNGFDLSSGVYFYRIRAGSFAQARKMILAK